MDDISTELYRQMMKNAADGIVTIDVQGLIHSFNPAAEKMFGYNADEMIGQSINVLMPEPDRQRHDSYIQHYQQSGQGHIIGIGPREVVARHRDGNTFFMDLAVSEMRQADGQTLFIGILRDISQRKQAEEELRKSEERFELVTRGTRDGIWDWDLTTGQIYFSSRWKTMLGYDEAEIEDDFMALQALIHPDDLGMALNKWMTCIEGETDAFDIEYRLRNKQDKYRWIQCRGLAQFDDNNNPVRLAGSHTDVTQRKQDYVELQQMTTDLETKAEALARSNQELEQFAYVTSHDLKAPLRAIANLSQWIEEDLDEVMTEDTRKQMMLLRGRVLRMENLINGVLQYSRVGRIDMDHENVDVAQLLTEVLDELAPPPGFRIDISPGMPTLCTARLPLFQVFANLIDNAIRFHHQPDTGQITVSSQPLNDHRYEFSISDNGPGIAPEYHDKVFQIFQTLNARDSVESTGVGLTVMKKIVEELGGETRLESAEGEGTTFHFTLPVESGKDEAEERKAG